MLVGDDVRGLQIAVNDAAAMGLLHRQREHPDQGGDGWLGNGRLRSRQVERGLPSRYDIAR